MLGLGDWWIAAAVVGCLVVSALGVIYGALNWNKSGENEK